MYRAWICKKCNIDAARERNKRPETRKRINAYSLKRYRDRKSLHSRLKYMAKIRGLEWTLTKGQFYEIRENPCLYCGDSLPEARSGSGLDRIDNSKGYTPENVVPCCPLCNLTRGNRISHYEMLRIIGPAIRLLKRRRELKSRGVNDRSNPYDIGLSVMEPICMAMHKLGQGGFFRAIQSALRSQGVNAQRKPRVQAS